MHGLEPSRHTTGGRTASPLNATLLCCAAMSNAVLCPGCLLMPCSPFMITGEAAQDLVKHEEHSSNSSKSTASPTAAATASTAAAGAAVTPAGMLSAAATAAASVSRGLPHLSGAAAHLLPHSWQLQKWPTEASESLHVHSKYCPTRSRGCAASCTSGTCIHIP